MIPAPYRFSCWCRRRRRLRAWTCSVVPPTMLRPKALGVAPSTPGERGRDNAERSEGLEEKRVRIVAALHAACLPAPSERTGCWDYEPVRKGRVPGRERAEHGARAIRPGVTHVDGTLLRHGSSAPSPREPAAAMG